MNLAPKSGISQLLIDSAIDAEVYRRLQDAPEETYQEYALAEEECELLRHPDHRLLRFLGAALEHQAESPAPPMKAPPSTLPPATAQGSTLPDLSLVLTLVPCAQYENGELRNFAYAVWVSPLAEGVDPASLGPPPGTVLPGQPLTPLHAVVQVSAVQLQDAAGEPHVGLSASLLQSTNLAAPPAVAVGLAVGRTLATEEVHRAVAAVRGASSDTRYGKLIELMHALRPEAAR